MLYVPASMCSYIFTKGYIHHKINTKAIQSVLTLIRVYVWIYVQISFQVTRIYRCHLLTIKHNARKIHTCKVINIICSNLPIHIDTRYHLQNKKKTIGTKFPNNMKLNNRDTVNFILSSENWYTM